jgi:hypothetical protein
MTKDGGDVMVIDFRGSSCSFLAVVDRNDRTMLRYFSRQFWRENQKWSKSNHSSACLRHLEETRILITEIRFNLSLFLVLDSFILTTDTIGNTGNG